VIQEMRVQMAEVMGRPSEERRLMEVVKREKEE
jgi:hypothetical protein